MGNPYFFDELITMKEQDPLFDLFRKNQYKLNERPHLRTWHRLEKRLNQKNNRLIGKSNTANRFFLMTAASIAFILCSIIALDMTSNNAYKKTLVMNEQIAYESEASKQLVAEQTFRAENQEKLMKVIEEGSTGRLIVATKPIRPFLIPRGN